MLRDFELATSLSEKKEVKSWVVSIATLVEGIGKLISSRPVTDRNLLLQGVAKSRSDLSVEDDAPLRRLYIENKDDDLYAIVTQYFLATRDLLWEDANADSFIMRTIGILALFDVLRVALIAKRVDIDNVNATSANLFKGAQAIDFSDDYFHASGAGRVRIRKVLLQSLGLNKQADLEAEGVIARLRHKTA